MQFTAAGAGAAAGAGTGLATGITPPPTACANVPGAFSIFTV